MGASVQYAHRWNIQNCRTTRFDRVSDIGQPHHAVVSRTETMMGASVQHARRWNIEMVELHISTVRHGCGCSVPYALCKCV